MNLASIMDEVGARLDTIAGLRVAPYSAARITPPAAVVMWPDDYTYDATFARGSDTMTLPVMVIAGAVDARSARDDLARFCDGSGPASVKATLEAGAYTSCDSVTVTGAKFGAVTVAGSDYLSATFDVAITGSGSA